MPYKISIHKYMNILNGRRIARIVVAIQPVRYQHQNLTRETRYVWLLTNHFILLLCSVRAKTDAKVHVSQKRGVIDLTSGLNLSLVPRNAEYTPPLTKSLISFVIYHRQCWNLHTSSKDQTSRKMPEFSPEMFVPLSKPH